MGYPIMRPSSRILVAIVIALAAAGAFGAAWVSLVEIPAPRVATSGTAAIGGPFTLVSTHGGNVTDQTYRGKWLLIFFGYTFCPDVCPTALNNVSVALEKLGADAGKLQALFVTVDPQRDTRKVMAEYLKSFDSRIIGLTVPHDQIGLVFKKYPEYVATQKSKM